MMQKLPLCILLIFSLSTCDIESIQTVDESWQEKYLLPEISTKGIVNAKMKAEIGRFLFHTGEVACVDCHFTEFGGTAGVQQSMGISTDNPPIKSPSNIGLAGSNVLLWNGGASGLEINHPFNSFEDEEQLSHNNWLTDRAAIIQVLFADKAHSHRFDRESLMRDNPKLEAMFKAAYPKVAKHRLCEIEDIAECIALYQDLHLMPYNSRQQQHLRRETYLSDQELRGWQLFETNCEGCHSAPFMGSDRFVKSNTPPFINDLHDGTDKANWGRMSVTGHAEDSLKFRIMRLQTNVVDHNCWGYSCYTDSIEVYIANHMSRGYLYDNQVDDIVAYLGACRDEDLTLIEH